MPDDKPYADTLTHFQVGQLIDPKTGVVKIEVFFQAGEWYTHVADFSEGIYWIPGQAVPRRQMRVAELLQRLKSMFGYSHQEAA